jgi:hypothetical protein
MAALGFPTEHWEAIATEIVEIGMSSRLAHDQPWLFFEKIVNAILRGCRLKTTLHE